MKQKRVFAYIFIAIEIFVIILLVSPTASDYVISGSMKGIHFLKNNSDVVSTQLPIDDITDLFEPSPGIQHQDGPLWLKKGYDLSYTINNDTLNERFNYATTAAPGTYRIMMLGDSWTYGMNVSTKDNYTEQLEDMLNELVVCPQIQSFEVINLGRESYDIAFSEERFKLRGMKYNPDTVIWFIHTNDFSQAYDYLSKAQTKKYEYLKATASPDDFPPYDDVAGYKGIRVSDHSDMLRVESIASVYKDFERTFTIADIVNYQYAFFLKFYDNFNKTTILYTPVKVFTYSNEALDALQRISQRHSNFLLYKTELDLHADYSEFNTDYHPSPVGHKRIALDMLNYLLKTDLRTCQLKE